MKKIILIVVVILVFVGCQFDSLWDCVFVGGGLGVVIGVVIGVVVIGDVGGVFVGVVIGGVSGVIVGGVIILKNCVVYDCNGNLYWVVCF